MSTRTPLEPARPGATWLRFAIHAAIATAAVLAAGGNATLLACPACFGAEETTMIDGTKIGVLVMLAVTLVVQGGFAGFFFYLRQRAKRYAEAQLEDEWSNLQRASRAS
jgi:heme/copper-type cytochrome/quinol oxidase subunit 2